MTRIVALVAIFAASSCISCNGRRKIKTRVSHKQYLDERSLAELSSSTAPARLKYLSRLLVACSPFIGWMFPGLDLQRPVLTARQTAGDSRFRQHALPLVSVESVKPLTRRQTGTSLVAGLFGLAAASLPFPARAAPENMEDVIMDLLIERGKNAKLAEKLAAAEKDTPAEAKEVKEQFLKERAKNKILLEKLRAAEKTQAKVEERLKDDILKERAKSVEILEQLNAVEKKQAGASESLKEDAAKERAKNAELEAKIKAEEDLKKQGLEAAAKERAKNAELMAQLKAEEDLKKQAAAVGDSLKADVSNERAKSKDLAERLKAVETEAGGQVDSFKKDISKERAKNAELLQQLRAAEKKQSELVDQLELAGRRQSAAVDSLKQDVEKERKKYGGLQEQLKAAEMRESGATETLKNDVAQEKVRNVELANKLKLAESKLSANEKALADADAAESQIRRKIADLETEMMNGNNNIPIIASAAAASGAFATWAVQTAGRAGEELASPAETANEAWSQGGSQQTANAPSRRPMSAMRSQQDLSWTPSNNLEARDSLRATDNRYGESYRDTAEDMYDDEEVAYAGRQRWLEEAGEAAGRVSDAAARAAELARLEQDEAAYRRLKEKAARATVASQQDLPWSPGESFPSGPPLGTPDEVYGEYAQDERYQRLKQKAGRATMASQQDLPWSPGESFESRPPPGTPDEVYGDYEQDERYQRLKEKAARATMAAQQDFPWNPGASVPSAALPGVVDDNYGFVPEEDMSWDAEVEAQAKMRGQNARARSKMRGQDARSNFGAQ